MEAGEKQAAQPDLVSLSNHAANPSAVRKKNSLIQKTVRWMEIQTYKHSHSRLYISAVLAHTNTDACKQALILHFCCHSVLVTEESPLRQLHTEWVGSTLQWCKGCRIWTKLFCSNTICALQRNAWIKSMNDASEPISANERLKVTEWHRKVRATWYHHSNKEKNQSFFHLCVSPHFCHLLLILYY